MYLSWVAGWVDTATFEFDAYHVCYVIMHSNYCDTSSWQIEMAGGTLSPPIDNSVTVYPVGFSGFIHVHGLI